MASKRINLAARSYTAEGRSRGVRHRVAVGHRVDTFDDLGKTPLHYAVEGDHIGIATFLIQAGANVNAHDESVIGNTPLGEVAATCSLQMAKLLVDAGADPTIRGWMQLNALDRGPTIEAVHSFIDSSGHQLGGKHHEIYLTDIRRAVPSKWRTVIRQPMG